MFHWLRKLIPESKTKYFIGGKELLEKQKQKKKKLTHTKNCGFYLVEIFGLR